jgi:hypothetical protein
MAKISRKALDWWLVVCIDVTVPAVIVWKYHFGEITRAVALISGLLSLAISNAVFLAAVHARNKRHGVITARSWFAGGIGLAVVSGVVTAGAVYLTPQHNEYADLAFSNIPLSQIHPTRKAILVELIRRQNELSLEYQKRASQMMPISPPLYSPESFATTSVMRRVTATLTQSNAEDLAYAGQVQQAMGRFRAEMGRADPAYLKSFEASDQKREDGQHKLTQLQEKWFHSVIALYAYASAESREITIRKGQLRFANTNIESELSRQMAQSKALYDAWQAQFQELSHEQATERRDVGLGANR